MGLPARVSTAVAALFILVHSTEAQILEGPLDRASSLIDRLDRPVPSILLDAGSSSDEASAEDRAALGLRVGEGPAEPTRLDRTRAGSRISSSTRLHGTPGTPAELAVGETRFVGDSPLFPPREVFTGRRLRLDGVRLVDDGRGLEADVEYEDTAPGAGPVVSTGLRTRTHVRMPAGGRTTLLDTSQDSTAESAGSGTEGVRRTRMGSRAGRRLDMGFEVVR